MRFTCEKSMLVTGLNITGRTVAQKSALSAIEGILCKAAVVIGCINICHSLQHICNENAVARAVLGLVVGVGARTVPYRITN